VTPALPMLIPALARFVGLAVLTVAGVFLAPFLLLIALMLSLARLEQRLLDVDAAALERERTQDLQSPALVPGISAIAG